MELDLVNRYFKVENDICNGLERWTKGDDKTYGGLLRLALSKMYSEEWCDLNDIYEAPDFKKIHEIDDGNYQGTLLFLVPVRGYQPSTYWVFKVNYGSCSGCDTLEAIESADRYDEDCNILPLSEQQKKDYMTLILHMIQSAKVV